MRANDSRVWSHASSTSVGEGTPKPCPTGALWRSRTSAESLSAKASLLPWVTDSACVCDSRV